MLQFKSKRETICHSDSTVFSIHSVKPIGSLWQTKTSSDGCPSGRPEAGDYPEKCLLQTRGLWEVCSINGLSVMTLRSHPVQQPQSQSITSTLRSTVFSSKRKLGLHLNITFSDSQFKWSFATMVFFCNKAVQL